MAHLNLLINGEKLCFAFEFKDKHSSNTTATTTSSSRLSGIDNYYYYKNHHHHHRQIRFKGCSKICGLGNRSNSYSAAADQLMGVNNDYDGFEYDEDGEFGRDELRHFRGLVLDISYRPVNIVCWKRAICLEFMEKADVLEYYEQTVNSPSGSFYIPAVLRVPNLLQVVKRRRVKQTLSRKSIFFRDAFTCQYCSSRETLTVDHVVPITRGGEWEWENLVTACARCNSRKGPKTLEEANMKLLKVPKAPKESDILAIPLTTAAMKTLKKKRGLPNEWHQYLGL